MVVVVIVRIIVVVVVQLVVVVVVVVAAVVVVVVVVVGVGVGVVVECSGDRHKGGKMTCHLGRLGRGEHDKRSRDSARLHAILIVLVILPGEILGGREMLTSGTTCTISLAPFA